MTTQITVESFTAAMRAAVEERGADFIYPAQITPDVSDEWRSTSGTCRYSRSNGEPACIVGLALHKIDPEKVPLPNYFGGADKLLERYGASHELKAAARRAQIVQDEGGTWGDALARYEEALSDMGVTA